MQKEVPNISNHSNHFPQGFLWGSATASYQTEGGIENTDWSKAGHDGKVPVCGKAVDHYNRFESDFDIARSLGQNAHRFSIEWARIEPEMGRFDEDEIEHYRKVIRSLKARGLEPFVTLWHFTLPIWFSEMGGFNNRNAPEIFSKYCEYVISKLGGEAKFWMTMNEPLVWSSGGYMKGKWPPFKKNFFSFIKINRTLIRAHRCAYKKIKKINPSIQVGIAKHNIFFSSNLMPWNIVLKKISNWYWNEYFLNSISNFQDFIGLNHYFYKKFGGNEKLLKSDMGWDIYPKAIFHCLIELKKYKKPIYVTENGIADATDSMRANFIRDYLFFVKKAIDEGVNVLGYFYWSLLDNFEWSYGFTEKFGLVSIKQDTFERTIRPSALIYKEIATNNVL